MAYHVVDGDDEAMSSIRLELLRDGIQDFERIRVLRENADPAAIEELGQMIRRFTTASGTTALPLVTEAQRLLDELVTATPGGP